MEYIVTLAFYVNESLSVGTRKQCTLGINVEAGIEWSTQH